MVLDNERVLDSYNYLVEQGAGREQWVLDTTEQTIKDARIPGVYTEQKDVSSVFLGDKRKFLVVRHAKYGLDHRIGHLASIRTQKIERLNSSRG